MAMETACDYSSIIPTPHQRAHKMKTAKQMTLTVLATLVIVVLASLLYKPNAHSSTINFDNNIEKITITAQRMSAEQKSQYDAEQAAMPSMVITGKAMTPAQKAAYDRAAGL
jgi:hypothetical protein